jgi:hypothetical protein
MRLKQTSIQNITVYFSRHSNKRNNYNFDHQTAVEMEQVAEATAGGVGAIASVLTTYPLTTTKIRLQAQRKKKIPIVEKSGASGNPVDGDAAKTNAAAENTDPDRPYSGAFDCIYRTGIENGIMGFFSGIESALFKG